MISNEHINTFFIISTIGFVLFSIIGLLAIVLVVRILIKLNRIIDDATSVTNSFKGIVDEVKSDVGSIKDFIKDIFNMKSKKKN